MLSSRLLFTSGLFLVFLGSASPPGADAKRAAIHLQSAPAAAQASLAPIQLPYEPVLAEPPAPPKPEPPPPPLPPSEALDRGVLVIVSLESQRVFVFKNGEPWGTSPVSTGKRGHETPTGTFSILQKKVHHRSNLYDDAPMPYMQRLTWGGIALHAGRVPGYPASHGCIRLPKAFAQKLYKVTGYTTTTVFVTDEPATSEAEALTLV